MPTLALNFLFQPKDGEPKIRILAKEQIQIKDNHFSMPLGKIDQLRAPEHFPPAVYRYTLRELSLVWHMYGGSDFDTTKCTYLKLLGYFEVKAVIQII